jgi:hypothetical protein
MEANGDLDLLELDGKLGLPIFLLSNLPSARSRDVWVVVSDRRLEAIWSEYCAAGRSCAAAFSSCRWTSRGLDRIVD